MDQSADSRQRPVTAVKWLWAKSRPDDAISWHPLALHLLDVAACADAILARARSVRWQPHLGSTASRGVGRTYPDIRVSQDQMLTGRKQDGNTIRVFSVLFERAAGSQRTQQISRDASIRNRTRQGDGFGSNVGRAVGCVSNRSITCLLSPQSRQKQIAHAALGTRSQSWIGMHASNPIRPFAVGVHGSTSSGLDMFMAVGV